MSSPLVIRFRGAVARRGVLDVAKTAAARLRDRLYLRERHVWYDLDLTTPRPALPLPDGFRLGPVEGPEDLRMLAEMREHGDALPERGELWIGAGDGQAVFSCIAFKRDVPMIAARGGWLTLPAGVVQIEDSFTAPAARGQSVAPAMWITMCDRFEAMGAKAFITKVDVVNDSSKRAIAKLGAREIAMMDLTKVGPFARVRISEVQGPQGKHLKQALTRSH